MAFSRPAVILRHWASSSATRCRRTVDFRTDQVTQPTAAMRVAMAAADVGNDIYGEDPTVLKLEAQMAGLLGKQSSIFVMSGTAANLLAASAYAALARGAGGAEVLLGDRAHAFLNSQGNLAKVCGLQTNTLRNSVDDGSFDLKELASKFRDDSDDHYPMTALVMAENTHNEAGGKVIPPAWTKNLTSLCRRNEIPCHLDGARLFNAAVASSVDVAELTAGFDSVSTCLSKGIGAPIGSVLAGSKDLIRTVRRIRKGFGGSGCQMGVMAAAGLVGLETAAERMALDHQRAKEIASAVETAGSSYVTASLSATQTNIVFLHSKCVSAEKLSSRLARVSDREASLLGSSAVKVLSYPTSSSAYVVRLVTHSDLSDDDVEAAKAKIIYVAENILERDN